MIWRYKILTMLPKNKKSQLSLSMKYSVPNESLRLQWLPN